MFCYGHSADVLGVYRVNDWKILLAILSLFFTLGQCFAASPAKMSSPWISLKSDFAPPVVEIASQSGYGFYPLKRKNDPAMLLKKADQEIENLNLGLARKYLETVLKEDSGNREASEQLAFVDFLQGKKSVSSKDKSSPETLVEKADAEITNLNLAAARNYLEIALKKKPGDKKAVELMALVDFLEKKELNSHDTYFNEGRAEARKPVIENFAGFFYRESDSGITEQTAILETTLSKIRSSKVSAGIFLESRGYEESNQEANSQVIGARLSYAPTSSSLVNFSISPEIFKNNKIVDQYGIGVSAKNNGWKFSLAAEKNTFRDNLESIQQRMGENDLNFTVSRKLNKKLELSQGIFWGGISDGNSSLSFNSKLKFRFMPGWALDLKYFQTGYADQQDENGDSMIYWAPQTYRMLALALDWKKKLAKKWTCEVETSFSGSATKASESSDDNYNAGLGMLVRARYKLSSGDVGLSYAHKIYLSSMEKRLNVEGSLLF